MADPSFIYMPAPHEGVDTSVAPHQLSSTKASRLLNFLVHEEGRLPVRGPVKMLTPSGAIFAGDGVTPFVAGQHVLAFPVQIEDKIVVNPLQLVAVPTWFTWRTFDSPAPDYQGLNAPIHGFPMYLDPSTMQWAKAGNGTGSLPGVQAAQYRGKVYTLGTTGLAGTNGTGLRIGYGGKYHGVTALFSIGPRPTDPIAFNVAAGGGEAPRATVALAAYSNRLWVGGGIAPNSTVDTVNGGGGLNKDDITNKTLTPNTLYFTNDGADPLSGIASWATLGVTNNIVVGSETSTDRIVGLAAAGRFLFVLKRYSCWVLTGSSIDSFNLRQISATDGVVDPRSIQVVNDTVFFLGPRGLMRYDGAELKMVSQAVNQSLLPALAEYGVAASGRGQICSVEQLAENYLLVTVGNFPLDSAGGGGTYLSAFSALYHTTTDRWTMFSAPTMRMSAPQAIVQVAQQFYGFDIERLADMTTVTVPLNASAVDRGFDRAFDNSKSVFPLQARFAPARASAPRARAQLNRFGAEYYFQQADGSNDAGRFQMQLIRYALQDNQDTGDVVTPVNVLRSRRGFTAISERPSIQWFEGAGEFTDLQVEFTRETDAGSLDTLYRAELLGAVVELQTPTHRRT